MLLDLIGDREIFHRDVALVLNVAEQLVATHPESSHALTGCEICRHDPKPDGERSTMGIASRAISTMIAANGINDVIRMYNATQRDGIDFNLAYIGSDFTQKLPTPFDQGYMRALFDYGYQRTRRGYEWVKQPPMQ